MFTCVMSLGDLRVGVRVCLGAVFWGDLGGGVSVGLDAVFRGRNAVDRGHESVETGFFLSVNLYVQYQLARSVSTCGCSVGVRM